MRGPMVRIMFFIMMPMIQSINCTMSMADVMMIKTAGSFMQTGTTAMQNKARLRANIYIELFRLFPLFDLFDRKAPIEKQSPRAALSKVVKAVT